MVHLLSEFSEGEALYRVDTRLRPEGEAGPLARSLASMLHYYEIRGRLWERFDEEHVERAYENRQIVRWLRNAGFRVRGFYHCFTFDRPRKSTYRICGVAQRA